MPKRNSKRTLEEDHKFFLRIPVLDYEYCRKVAFDNNEPISAVIRRAIREMKGRKA